MKNINQKGFLQGNPFLSKPKAFIWEKFRIIKWYDLFIKEHFCNSVKAPNEKE